MVNKHDLKSVKPVIKLIFFGVFIAFFDGLIFYASFQLTI